MNTVALIQARMGSGRLPCKSMLHLHGRPLIDWVVQRTAKAVLLDQLVVALPDCPLDDVLARHLEKQRVAFFRGPENDVLKRFSLAAEHFGATHIVRICADNPLISGEEIDNLIRHFRARACDGQTDEDRLYAYNHIPRNNSYPDGLGAEMISAALLHHIDGHAVLPEHREHCLSHIWDNSEAFTISTFDPPDTGLRHPHIRLDMDTAEDYRKLSLMDIAVDMPAREIIRQCIPG